MPTTFRSPQSSNLMSLASSNWKLLTSSSTRTSDGLNKLHGGHVSQTKPSLLISEMPSPYQIFNGSNPSPARAVGRHGEDRLQGAAGAPFRLRRHRHHPAHGARPLDPPPQYTSRLYRFPFFSASTHSAACSGVLPPSRWAM